MTPNSVGMPTRSLPDRFRRHGGSNPLLHFRLQSVSAFYVSQEWQRSFRGPSTTNWRKFPEPNCAHTPDRRMRRQSTRKDIDILMKLVRLCERLNRLASD